VIRDLPPVIRIDSPEDGASVAVNGQLPIRLVAQDDDFALRRVTLWGDIGGKPTALESLLDRSSPQKPWSGEFQGTFVFEPTKLHLKSGDRISIWGEAEDNKEPQPNHSVTSRQTVVVMDRDPTASSSEATDSTAKGSAKEGASNKRGKQGTRGDKSQPSRAEKDAARDASGDGQAAQEPSPPSEHPDKNEPPKEEAGQDLSGQGPGNKTDDARSQQSGEPQGGETTQGDGKQDNERQDGQNQRGQNQDGTQNGGEPSGRPNERIDPETDTGGAIQEILKERHDQEQKQTPPSQDSSQEGASQKGSAEEQKSSDSRSDSKTPGGQQSQDEASKGGQSQEQKSDGQSSDGKASYQG
jgi:hypothetical protein